MGALNPLFLVAALAAAIPVFLHLFQRQEARRVAFPALRYLERTEREHARRIRFRQLLLLLLRVAAVLAMVGAGARLFLRGAGAAHPPTAVVIVLDNSMSTGLVVGEERVLDHLKGLALGTLDAASEDDMIWVIRAGEPWLPAAPGGSEAARRVVEETAVSAAAGDLSAALARASELASTSGLQAREIHLLSDLQASAFRGRGGPPAGETPVVVWVPGESPAPNRALTGVTVGGGLPPLEGQRSEVTVRASAGDPDDTVAVPVRLVLNGRVRGAGAVPPGASLSLPLPAAPAGWVLGYADADADALRADDRRFFAFQARPAPLVALAGDVGVFLAEAVEVLESGGRLRRDEVRRADLVMSGSGEGLAGVGAGGSVLILPPGDPTLLPGLNRRLQESGIPWRVERSDLEGEAALEGTALPAPLQATRARLWYRLSLTSDPSTPTTSLALAAGDPWAVEGTDPSGRRYLLLASPLDAASTSLPVSADMIRFVDWLTAEWAATGGGSAEHTTGDPLSAPREAEAVRLPSGGELPLDGTRQFSGTGEAGIYAFLVGDSAVAYEALNPSAAESDLTALGSDLLEGVVGPEVTRVRRQAAWQGAIFRARQGPELWRPLVLVTLLLLVLEAGVAATGRLAGVRREREPAGAVRGTS
ncbi:MAG: BatA domain-containing protein [Longimicrobiales bacterium]|nr:BatA domain-containing protein [Longimicrobiales bacterium]